MTMKSSKSVDLFKDLDNNIKHFDNASKNQQKIKFSLSQLKIAIVKCKKFRKEIRSFAFEYDFDEDSPANGYRSFLTISKLAVREALKVCKRLRNSRENLLFRADKFATELDEWSKIIESLSLILEALIELHLGSHGRKLITNVSSYDNDVYKTGMKIDRDVFFGKNLSFFYVASLRPTVKTSVAVIAGFFEFFYAESPSFWFSLLCLLIWIIIYLLDPKKCAKAFVHACDHSTIWFCKAAGFLGEQKFIHALSSLALKQLDINETFEIQSTPMKIFSTKFDGMIDVSLPRSHIGLRPIKCRLLSSRKREGMDRLKLKPSSGVEEAEPSKYLIFHVHGGGFASQTSKSHEVYLREWAEKSNVPILSIDYSLAPTAPYPRALEEVFYAYCWVLNNPELVGSTGENIVFVGDSAGANLITACTIKCIEMGVRRPRGLINIYGVFMVNFSVSPSKFISVIDPFLPYTLSCNLVRGYSEEFERKDEFNGVSKNYESQEISFLKQNAKRNQKMMFKSMEEKCSCKLSRSYLVSPLLAPDSILAEFPPTSFIASDMDTVLDDSIEFGKKLRKQKVKVTVDIVNKLPHGFLCFNQASNECYDGTMMCLERIMSLLES